MKTKLITATISLLAALAVMPLAAQDDVDSVLNKSKTMQDKILLKDKEHRQRILEQFNKFCQRISKMAPGFKMQIPVDPDNAAKIKDNTHPSKYKKGKAFYAYTAEPYKLRSGPSDTALKDAILVKRGTKVQVLMMPELDEKAAKGNITDKWVLVKVPAGNEGYMPIDLLLKDNVPKKEQAPDDFMVKDAGPGSGDLPKKMKVTVSQLNVRFEPNQYSMKIDQLTKNTIVDVLEFSANEDYIDGQQAKWAKIRHQYLEGWVFSGYLGDPEASFDQSGGEILQSFTKGQSLYVKSDILRVRDAPSADGTVLFSLNNRDQVEVTEVEEDMVSLAGRKSRWVSVKYGDYEGWAFGAFLSKNSFSFLEGDDIDRLFIFPFNNPNLPITSNYGWRELKGVKSFHAGIDIGASKGTPVLAAADGSVISIKENNNNCATCSYGNCIILQHANGHRSLYAHLSAIDITMGQKVMAGDPIGKVGNTGYSFGNHLHFEVRLYEEHVDPNTYIHAVLDAIYEFFRYLASL